MAVHGEMISMTDPIIEQLPPKAVAAPKQEPPPVEQARRRSGWIKGKGSPTMIARYLVCTTLLLPLLSGCGATAEPAASPTVKLEIRRAADKPAEGLAEVTVTVRNSTHKVYMHKEAIIDNADIVSAEVVKDKTVAARNDPEGERFGVEVKLTKEGQEKFTKLTTDSVGQPIAILIDGQIVSAPFVRAPIASRKIEILGDFKEAEAERIAKGIVGK
jgi:hypothetical protein